MWFIFSSWSEFYFIDEEYQDVEEFNSEDFYAFAEDLEPKANILGNPIQRFNDDEEIEEFNLYLYPQLSQISTVIEDIIKDENKSQKLLNEFLYNKQNKSMLFILKLYLCYFNKI